MVNDHASNPEPDRGESSNISLVRMDEASASAEDDPAGSSPHGEAASSSESEEVGGTPVEERPSDAADPFLGAVKKERSSCCKAAGLWSGIGGLCGRMEPRGRLGHLLTYGFVGVTLWALAFLLLGQKICEILSRSYAYVF